jgi:magnesium-transporting ATPase (P-type)
MMKIGMQLDWMGIIGIILIVACLFIVVIVWVWKVSEEEKEQHRIVTSGRFSLFALKWYYVLLLIAGFILLWICLYEILGAGEITVSLGVLSTLGIIIGLLFIGTAVSQVLRLMRIRYLHTQKKKVRRGTFPPY